MDLLHGLVSRMDWGTAPDWLQALGVLAALYLGWRELTRWRAEKIGHRKIELAEQLLYTVYEIQDGFRLWTAPGDIGDYDNVCKSMNVDQAFAYRLAPLYRLHNAANKFAELRTLRLKSRIFMPPRLQDALGEILKVRDEIVILATDARRAQSRVASSPESLDKQADELQAIDAELFYVGAPWSKSTLSERLRKAIAVVEDECQPFLR